MGLVGRAIRRVLLGDTDLPQQYVIGHRLPESEIRVWFVAPGQPRRDVTLQHTLACTSPLVMGVALPETPAPPSARLEYREAKGRERLIGFQELKEDKSVAVGDTHLVLYRVVRFRNMSLPLLRIWAHYAHIAYIRWKVPLPPDEIVMTSHLFRGTIVAFIYPREAVLVTAGDQDTGNIFPINLMGHIGPNHFALALNGRRKVAPLLEKTGKAVLSSVPIQHAALARKLAKNHKRDPIAWRDHPLTLKPSPTLGIPMPEFASRIRELELESVHPIGSHTLFVARILRDERVADTEDYYVVHGTFQARRMREGWGTPSPVMAEAHQPKP